ncbi:hypothetical protein NS365_17740 [Aureimonas ureilytica]|uniref:GGDEF domain-containing protein n=1 Tax=Aureimonas ureilytica TaxID=401562 RepID=A0A175RK07_9HYPH|nr:hypothetical protein NS365_17740 [Aureimonas ureilytica]
MSSKPIAKSPEPDPNGATASLREIARPVSLCERSPHDLTVLNAAFATVKMGVWECSLPDQTLIWSDGVYDLFDLPRGIRPDRHLILQQYDSETRERLIALRAQAIRTGSGFECDARIRTGTGAQRWIRITATVEMRDGVPARIFGVKRDVTDELALLERMRHLAEHDEITQLANRHSFNHRLQALCEAAVRCSSRATLLLLDLDGFKLINDRLGHSAGDEVLRIVGQRLADCADGLAFPARIGGDEFALLTDAASAKVETLAMRAISEISRDMRVEGRLAKVGASIGIATRGDGNAIQLYREADAALYQAKNAGRGVYRIFSGVASAR